MIGDVLDGRYVILSEIGQGRHGKVYRARHQLMDRLVAVKVLSAALVADERARANFQDRCRALSALHHPNLVGLQDFGISPGGEPYLILDYVEGAALDEAIEKAGKLTVGRAIDIFSQVCSALSKAHQKGISHGDLKAAKVMLVAGDNGQESVKILDFGQVWGSTADSDMDVSSLARMMRESIGDHMPERLSVALNQASQEDPAKRSEAFDEIKTVLDSLSKAPVPRPERNLEKRSRDKKVTTMAAVSLVVLAAVLAWLTLTDSGRLAQAKVQLALQLSRSAKGDPAEVKTLIRIVQLEENLHRFREAAETYKQLLPLLRSTGAMSSMELGYAHKRVGDLYWSSGDKSDSLPEYRRSLAILLPIATDRLAHQEPGRAKPLLEELMTLEEKGFGYADKGFAEAVMRLGAAYESLGMYDRAELTYRRAVHLMENPACPDRYLLQWALFFLAETCEAQGKTLEAEKIDERVLAIRLDIEPGDALSLGQVYDSLAEFYLREHQYAKAQPAAYRAANCWERVLDQGVPLDPLTHVQSMARLSCIMWLQGKTEQFDSQLNRTLNEAARMQGSEKELVVLNYLADNLLCMGAPGRVALICRRVVEICDKSPSLPAWYRANAMRWLPLCALEAGDLHGAEVGMDQALAEAKRPPGIWPPALYSDQSEIRIRQGKTKESEELLNQAIAILSPVKDGSVRPLLIEALDRKARLLSSQGRPAEAEPLLVQATSLISAGQPVRLYLQLRVLTDHAALLRQLGRTAQAETLEKDLAHIRPPNPAIKI